MGLSGQLCFPSSSAGGMLVPKNAALRSRLPAPSPDPTAGGTSGPSAVGGLRETRGSLGSHSTLGCLLQEVRSRVCFEMLMPCMFSAFLVVKGCFGFMNPEQCA